MKARAQQLAQPACGQDEGWCEMRDSELEVTAISSCRAQLALPRGCSPCAGLCVCSLLGAPLAPCLPLDSGLHRELSHQPTPASASILSMFNQVLGAVCESRQTQPGPGFFCLVLTPSLINDFTECSPCCSDRSSLKSWKEMITWEPLNSQHPESHSMVLSLTLSWMILPKCVPLRNGQNGQTGIAIKDQCSVYFKMLNFFQVQMIAVSHQTLARA